MAPHKPVIFIEEKKPLKGHIIIYRRQKTPERWGKVIRGWGGKPPLAPVGPFFWGKGGLKI